MVTDSDFSPRIHLTLWMIRHVAFAVGQGHPLPIQVRRCLAEFDLSPADVVMRLGLVARQLGQPLSIAPPCTALRTRDEHALWQTLDALHQGNRQAAFRAMSTLLADTAATEDLESVLCAVAGLLGTRNRSTNTNDNGLHLQL